MTGLMDDCLGRAKHSGKLERERQRQRGRERQREREREKQKRRQTSWGRLRE